MPEPYSTREHIVILGAGFGGITALLKLYSSLRRAHLLGHYRLILVNRTDYHLYTPALYEIAALPRRAGHIAALKASITIPITNIIACRPGIEFVGDEIIGLDPERKVVKLKSSGELAYRWTVIAMGAETNYFGVPGLREHSLPLKTFEDAIVLRNRLEALGERNDITPKILIGGAGATGVELAAELVRFFARLRIEPGAPAAELTLVEAGPTILPGFAPAVVTRAAMRLAKLGVAIRTGTMIASVEAGSVTLKNGAKIPYDLFVWAGGVRPMEALRNCNVALDRRGGVSVNEFLEACPGVYAVGDAASFIHPETGKPLPGNVPVAEASGALAAQNIMAEIAGEPRTPFKTEARFPYLLAVGGKYAVADLIFLRFAGLPGWLVKQLVELHYLFSILPPRQAIRMGLRALIYGTRND